MKQDIQYFSFLYSMEGNRSSSILCPICALFLSFLISPVIIIPLIHWEIKKERNKEDTR